MFPYLKFLSKYWKNERGKIALIFVLVIFSQSFSLTEPFFFAKIIDDYLRQPQVFPTQAIFFEKLTLTVLAWIGVAFAAKRKRSWGRRTSLDNYRFL